MSVVTTESDIEAPNIKTSKTSAARKLADATKLSDERLDSFRKSRIERLKQYVGPYYNRKPGTAMIDAEPINTYYWLISTFVPALVFGGDVLADVTSPIKGLRPFGELFKLSLDTVYREMDFAGTLVKAVTDAFFGPGIIYTGLEVEPPGDTEDFPNWLQDPGVAFAECISLDKYVLDPFCTTRESAVFEGHDFLIAVADAQAAGYDAAILAKMKATHFEGKQEPEGAEKMSRADGKPGYDDEYVPHLAMRSVMLYRERVQVTIPADPDVAVGFLAEAEYTGSERGPYEMLGFDFPPDNPLPLPLMEVIADVHEVINSLTRKVKSQAERQKNLGLYDKSDEEGAEAIRQASDGQLVGVPSTDRVKEFSYGGADPRGYEAIAHFADWQNKIAGNPNLASGSEAEEDTLGQTQMMMGQVGVRLDRMRSIVHRFAGRVAKKIAEYVWDDPIRAMKLSQKIGRAEVPTEWTPNIREGSFEDYQIGVDLYSLRPDSPEARFNRTMSILERAAMPLAPLAAQQGVTIQVADLMQHLAKLVNLPEIDEWFATGQPIPMPAGVNGGGQQQPGGLPMQQGGTTGGRRSPEAVSPTSEVVR